MTDITKRLAEALRKIRRFSDSTTRLLEESKGRLCLFSDIEKLLADFDRTAAQEANVRGREFTSVCDQCGQANASWASTCGRCGINMAFHTGAPHHAPAPASVEVTDAEVEAACESWLTRSRWRSSIDEVRKETFRITMRRALEAATRARQGEGGRQVIGAINLTDMAKFLRGTATQCMSHGKTAAEAYEFCASELDKLAAGAITIPASGTEPAPNAADAEAYRAVTLEDAQKFRRCMNANTDLVFSHVHYEGIRQALDDLV